MLAALKNHSLTAIVAVGLDGAIGVNNSLPWRLKSDLRFFKKVTLDNIVVMGRKTFESIGGCLPKRDNIVLSRRPTLFPTHEGCVQAHSVGETLFLRGKSPRKEAFVIGGAQIYTQFAPYVDRYLLTVVNSKFSDADAHFSEEIIGDEASWRARIIEVDMVDDPDGDEFDFTVYELTHADPERVFAKRAAALEEYERKNPFLFRRMVAERASMGVKLDELLSLN